MKNLAVFGLALAPALALADSSTADAQLLPVVVTATRTPVAESDTLAQTIVIDRAQIERVQATDVAQILQHVGQRGGGKNGDPLVRLRGNGLECRQTCA